MSSEIPETPGPHPHRDGDESTGKATTSSRTVEKHAAPEGGDPHPAVIARGISVRGEEGPVYGPLDVEIPGTGLTVLSGRGGGGRTALALTISGRMKPRTGTLEVLGETKPSVIRKRVAIAGVDDIDLLDRDVRIHVILSEHRAWSTPWIMWAPRADQDYYESVCRPVFGERDLPPLDAYVSQISGLDRLLIRIALALRPANGAEIGMLVMDDLEQVHEFDDRLILVTVLSRLAEDIPVVVNAVNRLPDDFLPDYTLIELFTDASHLQPSHAGSDLDRIHRIAKEAEL